MKHNLKTVCVAALLLLSIVAYGQQCYESIPENWYQYGSCGGVDGSRIERREFSAYSRTDGTDTCNRAVEQAVEQCTQYANRWLDSIDFQNSAYGDNGFSGVGPT